MNPDWPVFVLYCAMFKRTGRVAYVGLTKTFYRRVANHISKDGRLYNVREMVSFHQLSAFRDRAIGLYMEVLLQTVLKQFGECRFNIRGSHTLAWRKDNARDVWRSLNLGVKREGREFAKKYLKAIGE